MYTTMKATEMLAHLLALKDLVAHGNIPAEMNGICSNLTIVSQVYSYGVEMGEWFEDLIDNAESNGMIKFDW